MKIRKFMLALFSALSITACASAQESRKISGEQGKKMMENDSSIILVDVRRADEFNEGHIRGAILIPNEEIGGERPDLLPDLDATIILYCRSGRRSAIAAKKLESLGYTKVYDMGGIISWRYGTVRQ